jgi:hypothetical protein
MRIKKLLRMAMRTEEFAKLTPFQQAVIVLLEKILKVVSIEE